MNPEIIIRDEWIEAAARAMASMDPDEDWPTNEALGGNLTGTRDEEYRSGMREQARDTLSAVVADIKAEALREAARTGSRGFDLMPTVAESNTVEWWYDYLDRLDQCWRGVLTARADELTRGGGHE